MTQERAILAGGCFWGMQDLIRKFPGVIWTRVGYSGGDVKNATYRNHGTHAEAIEVYFDPEKLSYRRLLEFFFQMHDPTTLNRQGNDVGTSYRSAIYYTSEAQEAGGGGHHRGCGRLGPVARQSGDGSRPGRGLLGSRARAPGLPGADPQRLHLPFRASGLDTADERNSSGVLSVQPSNESSVRPTAFCQSPYSRSRSLRPSPASTVAPRSTGA